MPCVIVGGGQASALIYVKQKRWWSSSRTGAARRRGWRSWRRAGLHRLRQTWRGSAGEVSAGSHGYWLVPWSARFVDPIILPDGRKLKTLRDAATYITELPKAQHDSEEWQTAMEVLLLVAERDGPEMMARIGMMRALNRHGAKATPAPRQKPAKAYRIVR
jgi:hypothetical protein